MRLRKLRRIMVDPFGGLGPEPPDQGDPYLEGRCCHCFPSSPLLLAIEAIVKPYPSSEAFSACTDAGDNDDDESISSSTQLCIHGRNKALGRNSTVSAENSSF